MYSEPTDPVPSDEAAEVLAARLEEVQPYVGEDTQSQRGALFELLADLTDDDGADAEMQDLGDWFHQWDDDGGEA